MKASSPQRGLGRWLLWSAPLWLSCAPAQAPEGGGHCLYRVVFSEAERASVEVSCEGPALTGLALNLPAAAPYTRAFQGQRELTLEAGERFVLARPGRSIRARYEVELGALAARYEDFDVARSQGGALISPAYSWLLTPSPLPAGLPCRLEVEVPSGAEFATGLAPVDGGYELLAQELPVASYAALGRLSRRTLPLPGREGASAQLEVVTLPEAASPERSSGEMTTPAGADEGPAETTAEASRRESVKLTYGEVADSDREATVQAARDAWVAGAARAVVSFWRGFPVPRATLFVVPVAGRRRALFGKLLPASGPGVVLLVGAESGADELADDWILVHELFHLGVPSFSGEGKWLDEGLATYFEPLIRARSLGLPEQVAWRELAQGFERGVAALETTGLERTSDFGAVYWGGALVCLLADIEIRRASLGQRGLEDGLREVLRQGGHAREVWSLSEVARVVGVATGSEVLAELVARYGYGAAPVSLDAILASVGVQRSGASVTLEREGEAAWLRRSITFGGPQAAK